ncbi:MAG: hypothetical protein K2N38_03860 [Oscillospiraceae bacterium]|nr:hypothetical protein [Oscillospiraceae bacterium]
MEISINTRQIGYNFTAAATRDSVESVFGEMLTGTLENKEVDDKIGNGVPGNWSDLGVWISQDGYVPTREKLNEFRDIFLEKLGIDLENRGKATHEITAEQEEWLALRYDLSALQSAAVGSAEHNNFMLDLVYLNVFSIEETVISHSTVVSFAPGEKGRITFDDESISSAESFIDSMAETADALADFLMEYIARKYGKVKDAPDEVKEWYENANKIVEQKREVYDVLKKFFDRLADDSEQENNYNGLAPNIEDAALKLKEDFGRLI